MSDRQMEFRVGLFVVAAIGVATFMVFHFGEWKNELAAGSHVTVRFEDAGGIHIASPVRMSGIQIGTVRDIRLDDANGGVLVLIGVRPEYQIRTGSRARIVSSLLGDAAVEFSPGIGSPPVPEDQIITGLSGGGPLEAVDRLEGRMGQALDVFAQTGREWGRVGANLNQAMGGADGRQMQQMIQQTVASLQEFTRTMRTANQTLASAQNVLGNPDTQADLRATLSALPELVNDTRQAIQAVKLTVHRVDRNMQHIDAAMQPIAKNSEPMARRLNNTLANLESLTGELAAFSKLLRTRDGSMQRLVSDPSLYRNLNATAASLAVFLKNAEPVLADLRVFSDKIARHPELIGVRGAIRGSSGIKQVDFEEDK